MEQVSTPNIKRLNLDIGNSSRISGTSGDEDSVFEESVEF